MSKKIQAVLDAVLDKILAFRPKQKRKPKPRKVGKRG
jgi:hypothetical protein